MADATGRTDTMDTTDTIDTTVTIDTTATIDTTMTTMSGAASCGAGLRTDDTSATAATTTWPTMWTTTIPIEPHKEPTTPVDLTAVDRMVALPDTVLDPGVYDGTNLRIVLRSGSELVPTRRMDRLRSLDISQVGAVRGLSVDLPNILRLTPHLTKLRLSTSYVGDAEAIRQACPPLRRLWILSATCQLLRWLPHQSLESLHVHSLPGDHLDAAPVGVVFAKLRRLIIPNIRLCPWMSDDVLPALHLLGVQGGKTVTSRLIEELEQVRPAKLEIIRVPPPIGRSRSAATEADFSRLSCILPSSPTILFAGYSDLGPAKEESGDEDDGDGDDDGNDDGGDGGDDDGDGEYGAGPRFVCDACDSKNQSPASVTNSALATATTATTEVVVVAATTEVVAATTARETKTREKRRAVATANVANAPDPTADTNMDVSAADAMARIVAALLMG